jgi:glucuronoarabinoxylan endo-1,4-beta-xylanase
MTFPIGLALSDYSDATLNDSTAVNNIAVVGGHFYGNGNYVHQNALNHGKHV